MSIVGVPAVAGTVVLNVDHGAVVVAGTQLRSLRSGLIVFNAICLVNLTGYVLTFPDAPSAIGPKHQALIAALLAVIAATIMLFIAPLVEMWCAASEDDTCRAAQRRVRRSDRQLSETGAGQRRGDHETGRSSLLSQRSR